MVVSIIWLFLITLTATAKMSFGNSSGRPIKPSEVEKMYNNSLISDIQFTFGENKSGEIFYAHKYVLAISSPVFHEMFYSKTEKPIVSIYLQDYNSKAVTEFFSFVYKDECPKDFENDIRVLGLMKKYAIVSFDSTCSDAFQRNTELQKACKLLDQFLELKVDALAQICMSKIDLYPDEYFSSDYFLNIKQATLAALLNRDTLWYNETDIFKAVLKWADHQCSQQNLKMTQVNRRKVVGHAIYTIRFLLMNLSEFATHVLPTDFLDDHEIVAIMRAISGEQIPNLAWDSVWLRSKRFHEVLTRPATEKKSTSWTGYISVFFFWYFIPLLKYLIFIIGLVASAIFLKENIR